MACGQFLFSWSPSSAQSHSHVLTAAGDERCSLNWNLDFPVDHPYHLSTLVLLEYFYVLLQYKSPKTTTKKQLSKHWERNVSLWEGFSISLCANGTETQISPIISLEWTFPLSLWHLAITWHLLQLLNLKSMQHPGLPICICNVLCSCMYEGTPGFYEHQPSQIG